MPERPQEALGRILREGIGPEGKITQQAAGCPPHPDCTFLFQMISQGACFCVYRCEQPPAGWLILPCPTGEG